MLLTEKDIISGNQGCKMIENTKSPFYSFWTVQILYTNETGRPEKRMFGVEERNFNLRENDGSSILSDM